jgi:hypothetical protein
MYCGLVLLLLIIVYNLGNTMDPKTLRSNLTDVNNYYYYNINELEDNNPRTRELLRCILL